MEDKEKREPSRMAAMYDLMSSFHLRVRGVQGQRSLQAVPILLFSKWEVLFQLSLSLPVNVKCE